MITGEWRECTGPRRDQLSGRLTVRRAASAGILFPRHGEGCGVLAEFDVGFGASEVAGGENDTGGLGTREEAEGAGAGGGAAVAHDEVGGVGNGDGGR